jgi:mannitol/fructose-specific phosphotransferase system IIA component (Ntr-type)
MTNAEDFLEPKPPVIQLKARDRWQAIVELMDALVAAGKITAHQRPAIENAVKRRETAMSTGIGFGVGIPHALSNLIKEPVAAFGRSKLGINFDAPDNKPVFKVCLFLTPAAQFSRHTQILASIAKRLHHPDF